MTQITLTAKDAQIISKGATGNDVVVASKIVDGTWIMNNFIDSTSMFLAGEGNNISDEEYEAAMVLSGF